MTINVKFLAAPFIASHISIPLWQAFQDLVLIQNARLIASHRIQDKQIIPEEKILKSFQDQFSFKNENHHKIKLQQKNPPVKTATKGRDTKKINSFIDGVKGKLISGAKKSYKKMKGFFDGFGAKLGTKRTLASYQVNEYVSKDKKKYCLVIMMPIFTEEQTRIAFCQTPQGDCTLKIIADTSASSDLSPHDELIEFSPSSGESHSMYYHNGKLVLSICLPKDVDPQTYSMRFENHTMKIEFERKDSMHPKRYNALSSNKQSQAKD